MVRDFTYPVYIPSLGEWIRVREIKNQHLGIISKYITNNDSIGLDMYLNKLIVDITQDKHTIFNKIDKFCILLTARILCIGSEIQLTFKCKKTEQQYNGTIDLNNVLQLVSDVSAKHTRTVKLNEKISAVVGIPLNLYFDDTISILDSLTDIIHELIIDDEVYNMKNLSVLEKNKVINSISGLDYFAIMKKTGIFQRGFKNLVYFKDQSPHDDEAELKEYKLGLYDRTMFDLIKLSYTYNLNDFYNMLYTLCSTLGFTYDHALSITPIESSVYIQRKAREIEEQQKKSQQQQPTSVGMPQPSSI